MGRIPLDRAMLAALLVAPISYRAPAAYPATTQPSKLPAPGVDLSSPQAAYAAALAAEAAADKKKLISLYDYPLDVYPELVDARAEEDIDHYQIVRELQKRFPGQHATFPGGRPIPTTRVDPLRPLPEEAWRIETDRAMPSHLPGMSGAPSMVLRDDGWHIQIYRVAPAFNEIQDRVLQTMQRRIGLEQAALRELRAGKFKTIDDFLDAEEPSRGEFRRRHEQTMKEIDAFHKEKSDTTTIDGFTLALIRDGEKPDVMASYLYIPGDDGSYARARIQYSMATTRFFTMSGSADQIAGEFGLVHPLAKLDDLIMWRWTEQGDIAVPNGVQTGNVPPLRKIDGHWKMDLSAEAGSDLKARVAYMMDDAAKIDAATEQIIHENLSTPDQIRSALLKAKLHSATLFPSTTQTQ